MTALAFYAGLLVGCLFGMVLVCVLQFAANDAPVRRHMDDPTPVRGRLAAVPIFVAMLLVATAIGACVGLYAGLRENTQECARWHAL